MKKASLIIDIGTGSTRVALVTRKFEIKEVLSFSNTYYEDERYKDAKLFDPEELERKIYLFLSKIVRNNPEYLITHISSSAARESVVLIDETGKSFLGLPNIDNRGKEYLHNYVHNETLVRMKTGRPLTEDFVAMKLVGLKEKDPKAYKRIKHIVSLSEWIGYLLSGILSFEFSQACETQLFNIHEMKWDSELFSIFDLDRTKFTDVIACGTEFPIKEHLIDKYSFSKQCVYVVGGADTQLAAKGMFLARGELGLISGTSSPVVSYMSEVPNFRSVENLNYWVGNNLKGENYQLETNPGVTGLNLQLAKNLFVPNENYETLDRAILANLNGDSKCTASFTTQKIYNDTPLPMGGFLLKVPFSQELTMVDLFESLVFDIACSISKKIEVMEIISQFNFERIIGSGGGLRSEALCQIIANLTNKPLILKENYNEASIIGGTRICFERTKDSHQEDIEPKIIKTYQPEKSSKCLEIYEHWLGFRNKINN